MTTPAKSIQLLLLGTCIAAPAAIGAQAAHADEDVTVLAQEIQAVRSSDKVAAALWTRRPDSYTMQVVLPRGTLRYPFLRARQGTASAADNLDRNSVFIGKTIGALRGLDPTYGEFTLTLIDGRRQTDATAAASQSASDEVRPAGLRIAPIVPRDPPKISIWLLRADGTQISPSWRSPDPSAESGCDSSCMADEIVYRFSVADGEQAVAAAVSIDGEYYIEKLRPLGPAGAAR